MSLFEDIGVTPDISHDLHLSTRIMRCTSGNSRLSRAICRSSTTCNAFIRSSRNQLLRKMVIKDLYCDHNLEVQQMCLDDLPVSSSTYLHLSPPSCLALLALRVFIGSESGSTTSKDKSVETNSQATAASLANGGRGSDRCDFGLRVSLLNRP